MIMKSHNTCQRLSNRDYCTLLHQEETPADTSAVDGYKYIRPRETKYGITVLRSNDSQESSSSLHATIALLLVTYGSVSGIPSNKIIKTNRTKKGDRYRDVIISV